MMDGFVKLIILIEEMRTLSSPLLLICIFFGESSVMAYC